jgi:N-acetylglutamate synthase-like GNAT family acetyltransferase
MLSLAVERAPDNLWVAVHENKAVGLVGLIVEEREAVLEPTIVSKGYCGKGIGTKLVETVVYGAQKRGVGYLDVKSVTRNVETIEFFGKSGFRDVGHVDLFADFSNRTWKRGLKIHGCKFNY